MVRLGHFGRCIWFFRVKFQAKRLKWPLMIINWSFWSFGLIFYKFLKLEKVLLTFTGFAQAFLGQKGAVGEPASRLQVKISEIHLPGLHVDFPAIFETLKIDEKHRRERPSVSKAGSKAGILSKIDKNWSKMIKNGSFFAEMTKGLRSVIGSLKKGAKMINFDQRWPLHCAIGGKSSTGRQKVSWQFC